MFNTQPTCSPASPARTRKPHKGVFSGSTLKLVAIGTMLVDHTAAVLLLPMLQAGLASLATQEEAMAWVASHAALYWGYPIMRYIGRIAFPIFCFLLVEGFTHTHNVWRYAGRLALFALASEIPFDLAFQNTVLEFTYQNVFFTLLCALVGLIGIDACFKKKEWLLAVRLLLCALCGAGAAAAAGLLQTDYGFMGVVTVLVFYVLRRWPWASGTVGCATLCAMNVSELTSVFAIPFIGLYSGKRGLRLKYVFYAFYPCHLLLLWGVAKAMGLA